MNQTLINRTGGIISNHFVFASLTLSSAALGRLAQYFFEDKIFQNVLSVTLFKNSCIPPKIFFLNLLLQVNLKNAIL
jgi:hypothetical protein